MFLMLKASSQLLFFFWGSGSKETLGTEHYSAEKLLRRKVMWGLEQGGGGCWKGEVIILWYSTLIVSTVISRDMCTERELQKMVGPIRLPTLALDRDHLRIISVTDFWPETFFSLFFFLPSLFLTKLPVTCLHCWLFLFFFFLNISSLTSPLHIKLSIMWAHDRVFKK